MLISVLCVAVGAIFGALARFLITHLSSELSHHHGFPYGTLAVNVVGCLIVGYVLTWTSDHEHDLLCRCNCRNTTASGIVCSADERVSPVNTNDGRPLRMERETGIEPATPGLGSRCSTIELLPLCQQSIS